jgi:hypothetical protein
MPRIAVLTVPLVTLVLGLGWPYYTARTVGPVEVTDKQRVIQNEESYYRLYTREETFRNSDTVFYLKFRSSELQGRIPVGAVCTFRVYGLRIPILSRFRNVVSADCD